jgi:5-deoxy-D-glucuronate isomerase
VALVNVIPDLGGSFEYLIRAGPRGRIGMARGRGSATGSTGAAFAWIVVEGGEGEIVAGALRTEVGGREDVFDGPGWSVLVGPKTRFAFRGNLRYTIAGRSWGDALEPQALPPDGVEETAGRDGRATRTYVHRGPFVCGETVHEPGAWASWPERLEHEALFLYRLSDPDGFMLQVLENKEGGRRADVVTDGEVRRIRGGAHPVVASPAGETVIVWVLAAAGETATADEDDRRR